ncbi:hypothetical protein EYZ11_001056 [Aspergillus tanneri]|nr:hypothetical protein EYZ11_001056 [Aspergillus tanneri]
MSSMLFGAARNGHAAIVRYLAYLGWLDRDMCKRALVIAASEGHSAVVKSLLDCGFEFGHSAKYLLDGDEFYKSDKEIALSKASTAGDLAVLDLLLEPGAEYDLLALYPAVCAGQVERVHAILSSGIGNSTSDYEADRHLRMSLCRAAEHGLTTIVKLLLNAGVPPDALRFSTSEPSALYRAARAGHRDVVDLLVKAGADISRQYRISLREERGYTALYIAARGGHVTVIDCLINSGAPVSFQGAEGHTALHAAVRSGHTAAVEFLINAGAAVSIQANSGATPLHYAARYNRSQVVKLLLNAGADPFILDREGRSAHNRAVEFQHSEVVVHLTAAENCMK